MENSVSEIPAIEIDNVSKRFGAVNALQNISLCVQAGENLALIGPTMAGKTVLLKILAGLYPASIGTLNIGGQMVGTLKTRSQELNNRIGVLFQHNALFDSLPVWENIAFRLIAQGMNRAHARHHAEALLPQVGLKAEVADLFPASLSGGMQKRVGFARAIATEPDLLLLDNPTAGLDPILSARIEKMIHSYTRKSDAAVISITTNMALLADYYDRVAVLHDGVLRWQGAAQDLHKDQNPYLQQVLSGNREGPIETILEAS